MFCVVLLTVPYTNTIRLKKHPFIRLLACFVAGIIGQWFGQFSLMLLMVFFAITCILLAGFKLASTTQTYTLNWVRGILVLLLFVYAGAIITFAKDARHNPQWVPNHYQPGQKVLLTIEEPLVEKPKSWKALASVTAVQDGHGWQKMYGKAIVYFYKGSKQPPILYGTQIILHKALQPIKNSGNPGAFNYEQYCLLQQIAYQTFIYPSDFVLVPGNNGNAFQQVLYKLRDAAIAALKNNIPGEKESGVAEALLIGYRADLDADLVQAYTNTGVIHIVAISGLHLAMIYALLVGIWGLLPNNKFTYVAKPISIFIFLWAFTLLAGAAPSIGRAAVMFSFLVLGEVLGKKTNTYNNLAASAFFLLVYNPFYLWDAGFILSYSAVLSIVAFYRPVYNWFYVKNTLLNKVWEATAVTIAAQILTVPVILFYFHQFANLFLIANFIAVPLSGFILYGELLLLLVAAITPLAQWVGFAVGLMIKILDGFIEYINRLPFAVWNNIYADIPQTLLLYAFVIAASVWLLKQSRRAFIVSLLFLATMVVYTSFSLLGQSQTQKLIVYNVAHQTAIDIIQGHNYRFIGDSALLQEGPPLRYNLKPARIMYRVTVSADTVLKPSFVNGCLRVHHTKILLLDDAFNLPETTAKIPVDIIILSKKPTVTIPDINRVFAFKQLVFDSSNPMLKIRAWKKACDSLHLRFYSVPEQGAFEINL